MKKIVRFNLLLTLFAGIFVALAAFSSPSKEMQTKGGKANIALRPDSTNCANYYEVAVAVRQVPCGNTCPPGCREVHRKIVEGKKVLKTCPKGKLYNPAKLACDFPDRVVCKHTPRCTND